MQIRIIEGIKKAKYYTTCGICYGEIKKGVFKLVGKIRTETGVRDGICKKIDICMNHPQMISGFDKKRIELQLNNNL